MLFLYRKFCSLRTSNAVKKLPKIKRSEMAFVDTANTKIEGGKGGDGIAHFAREPFKAVAPPDGGDGGSGGNVWLEIGPEGYDLRHVLHSYRAENGQRGAKNRGKGALGDDIIIKLPKGTVIQEYIPSTLPDPHVNELNEDMIVKNNPASPLLNIDTSEEKFKVGAKVLLATGGLGGRGNSNFASSQNRSPLDFTLGQLGQIRYLRLELKILADVGLVGLPNAGKSSFLKSVSRSKTKVADYEFTTLFPQVATIHFDAEKINNDSQSDLTINEVNGVTKIFSKCALLKPFSLTLADIPGIIKGASVENRGLGHSFLRHIEKSRLLCFVVDLSRPEPCLDLQLLIEELESYKKGMVLEKTCMILANKADIAENQIFSVKNNFKILENFVESNSWTIVPISAKYSLNVTEALKQMRLLLQPVTK